MIWSQIPHAPGAYIFKDQAGKILYVGKAIDLNSRVSSYFRLSHPGGVTSWVNKIARVETIVVESELEALILEANLIKKYLPPFNVRLTDDKDYLYIAVTKEDFPKIITARKKDLPKKYWGPFPSSRTVRDTLKSLRRVFPWCLNVHSRSGSSNSLLECKRRPCFYFHLDLCPGPCAGAILQKDYQKIILRFAKFMDGKKDRLIADLTAEMKQLSQKQNFEEAARIKKVIEGVLYLTQANRTKFYLENPNFLQEERQLALEGLKKDLGLHKLPERIEGYDISNLQGKEATGSMVVLTGGEIDKSQYRKFKINPAAAGPNDVGMMGEMIRRRLKHPEWPMPDLIIIDGGRAQAKATYSILHATNYLLPIFGLAKRMEWLYPPEGDIIKLSKKSLSLKLLQKLRDEAHRFAITYHRKLHGKILMS